MTYFLFTYTYGIHSYEIPFTLSIPVKELYYKFFYIYIHILYIFIHLNKCLYILYNSITVLYCEIVKLKKKCTKHTLWIIIAVQGVCNETILS